MTRDEIIRMAREAGINAEADTLCRNEGWVEPLELFAAIVAKHTLANIDPSSFMSFQEGYAAGVTAEREACAKVCEDEKAKAWEWTGDAHVGGYFADTIRARGNT